jgi:hypothetical protein
MKKYLLITLTLALLGCNGSRTAQQANPVTIIKPTDTIINGFKVPVEPDPIENNKTFLGIDSDRNGIRDDVDREIAKKSKTVTDKEMASMYARDLIEAIKEPEKAFSEEKYQIENRYGLCYAYIKNFYPTLFAEVKIDDEHIKNHIFNTDIRKKKLYKYDSNLRGKVLSIPGLDDNQTPLVDCPKYIQERAKTIPIADPLK